MTLRTYIINPLTRILSFAQASSSKQSSVGYPRPKGRAPNDADGKPKIWNVATGKWMKKRD